MKPIRLPKPVRREDRQWWIPRCPPHLMQSCGPYDTRADAESDRAGMQETMNTPAWRSVLQDLEEEEE
jgi:hypothetical protein